MNTSISNSSRVFSEEEIQKAENMLIKLANKSADYWMNALGSERFIVNGKRLDYTRGYKDRVIEILRDPNAVPISQEQLQIFKDEYLLLAKERIKFELKDDIAIAYLLNQTERVIIPIGKGNSDFSFGGWDNDPYGAVAEAMKKAKICGKMSGYYTKTRISLLRDGCIHEGWYLYSPILERIYY